MKNLLIIILLSSSFAHASVIPADNSERLVQDELFVYQWGLYNQGQTLIREKDDIHNLPMKGVLNKDIGWKNLVGKFSAKRPIIAVLDSGVDLTHPELQGNFWKNEAECNGKPDFDDDNNQLKDDCNGWNFTEAITSEGAKDPTDIDGHGTHIAGIIAAANDGTGMVGVTPNALIMPIKVMKDSNSKSDVPSSEAFARGIQYAVQNGADVINMSLGWPRSLETALLRDAVNFALRNGVVIVAAAGNNNSSEPLFPCAYDGVICVGASTINGKFAGFSNYGGHVDTIAPGEGILGLNPVILEPEFFPVPGFELRSGTSQAAPLLAGMIGALKAKNKDTTIDQIFAKLYSADSFKSEKKYIMGGEATWESLNAEITTPVIRPIFKKVRQIVFRADSPETKISVSIRNFGLPSGAVSVKMESLSKGIEINSDSQSIEKLNQGEFKDLIFDINLKNLNAESNVAIKVTIEDANGARSYVNEIPVVRDIYKASNFKKAAFVFADKPVPVGGVRGKEILSFLSTVESFGVSTKHEFFMKRIIKDGDNKKLEILLFTKQGDKYVQSPANIYVNDALSMVNFIRVDMNLDGKEDYLVQTLIEKDSKKSFVFSFYNSDMKPLWPKLQDAKLNLDLFVESMNDISFIRLDHATLGKMMVPAFFTNGMLPKIDQPITSWQRLDSTRKKRLYYLEPMTDGSLRIRSLTTNVWEESVKTEFKTKWFDTVETEQLLPVSAADSAAGNLRVMVTVGSGTKRQIFIYSFNTKASSHGLKIPQLVLQTDSVDPLLTLTNNGLVNSGDVYFNIYDRTRAKLVTTKNLSQEREFIFRHETESDLIAGHIASFENNNDRFTVFQTREELISITSGANSKRSSRPKLRYSFLSQKLLSEMYFPVSYKRQGASSPALYVDATSVTGNRIYLFEEQNGELVSSIRNSLVVPNNCRALNPNFSAASGSHEFIFICLEDKGAEKEWMIRSLEMN